MCGIIAFLGKNNNIYKIILNGLEMLQNRGYDSAGISTITDNKINTIKYATTNKDSAIKKLGMYNFQSQNNNVGIGHTRWATHGAKTDDNAHPHSDYKNRISLVHNGIIENYYQLKLMLQKNNIPFKSSTDTEVIANLIGYYLDQNLGINYALEKALSQIEGTWGIVLIYNKHPKKLYCTRNGSPLLVGFGDKSVMVSSEPSGFLNLANNYICLNNNEIICLEIKNDKIIFPRKNLYNIKKLHVENISNSPSPWNHWTIKEIMEQKHSIQRSINMGGRIMSDCKVKLGGLVNKKKDLLKIDNLIILGCGTSFNAGSIGKFYFMDLECFNSVQVIDGAEFNKKYIPKNGISGFLLLSQSGETKDLHRCMKIARDNNIIVFSIINVVNSLIARDSDCGVYLNAGREVGVASTKSFTSQVTVLALIAIWFAQNKNINKYKRYIYIESLRNLSRDIDIVLNTTRNISKEIAKTIMDHSSSFLLGKGISKYIANEGSLKLKELSYIHAEGYCGSALKHGPFALLCKDFPVFLIMPYDEHFNRMMGAAEEIKSRLATNIIITDATLNEISNKHNFDWIINIPKNKIFSSLLSVIPLQFISYELSLLKGINPDYPKNLAKVVTVD